MQSIKEYLLSVIAAAIICAVVSQIAGKGSFLTAAIKLISGAFMLVVLISPMKRIQIKPANLFSDISLQANEFTAAAAESTQESMASIIKEQVAAYILDKANQYGAALTVDVVLSAEEIPTPTGVKISGKVSPYTRRMLSGIIANDLGIPVEAQIWN